MANQNSIISYAPQPFFEDGTPTIVNHSNVSSIENSTGVFDVDLSNYTTVVPTASSNTFAVKIDFNKTSAHLANSDITLALVGCSMLTYADSGGSPDLATEFSENITCKMSCDLATVTGDLMSIAHNSQDTVHAYGRSALPSVISGGRTNLIFHGLGAAAGGSTGTVYVTFERVAADVTARPHVRLQIGHLFVGVDVAITIDPRTFAWTMLVENERFKARDFGAINSDGTLVRRSLGEIIKIANETLVGSTVTSIAPSVVSSVVPNFLDLVKANVSYPLLFNPYPRTSVAPGSLTVEEANYTARQNFFSIYGFIVDPMEINTSEYRGGLNSEFRVRFRIEETR